MVIDNEGENIDGTIKAVWYPASEFWVEEKVHKIKMLFDDTIGNVKMNAKNLTDLKGLLFSNCLFWTILMKANWFG